MYKLIESLKHYEHTFSAFPFGEFVHYTDKRNDFDIQELNNYLISKELSQINIEVIKPTIEDTFMALSK
jgi:ABC-2 type transport system ATP-binding protein